MAQKEYTQLYPRPGWVEHDPMEIYASQYGVLVDVLAHERALRSEEIDGSGHHKSAGNHHRCGKRIPDKPIYNAIVWQCRRTAAIVRAAQGGPTD